MPVRGGPGGSGVTGGQNSSRVNDHQWLFGPWALDNWVHLHISAFAPEHLSFFSLSILQHMLTPCVGQVYVADHHEEQTETKISLVAFIFSALVYGGMLSLTMPLVRLLLKSSYEISRRKRIFLLIYVTFMAAISTAYMVITSIVLKTAGGLGNKCFDILARGLCIVFSSWGADGFMVSQNSQRKKNVFLISFFFHMYHVPMIALAMCGTLWGNNATTSNNFAMCSRYSSVNVIGYVSL